MGNETNAKKSVKNHVFFYNMYPKNWKSTDFVTGHICFYQGKSEKNTKKKRVFFTFFCSVFLLFALIVGVRELLGQALYVYSKIFRFPGSNPKPSHVSANGIPGPKWSLYLLPKKNIRHFGIKIDWGGKYYIQCIRANGKRVRFKYTIA